MGIYRQFPYSNFHEMNLDWLLDQIRKLEGKWEEFVVDWDDNLKEEVNNWLTEHPEYTTTVMDNSITSIKLDNDSIPFYNVLDYGIESGDHDQYEALHELLKNKVFHTGGIVFFPAGRYIISDTIFIPENTMFLGMGEESEIYFDESNTWFGVGLSNAGSNVTINNLKVTQKTKGVFHSGGQPGCIGFSDNDREMARQDLHSRVLIRAEVKNLTAKNIYSDTSQYILQTENDPQYPIYNVIYENIKAPNSCVSIMASAAGIYNVSMTNIESDLFRISWQGTGTGVYQNVVVNNVICQRCVFYCINTIDAIIVNNLTQTTNARKDDSFRTTACCGIDTNIIFNDCIFNAIEGEPDGIVLYDGIRTFNNCIFNAYDKAATRVYTAKTNTNYDILNNCICNTPDDGNTTVWLGYGHNNVFNGKITSYLWGDMHHLIDANKLLYQAANVTNTIPRTAKIENDTIIMSLYLQITNTNNICGLTDLGNALCPQEAGNTFLVTIFNSNTPTAQINTFARFESRTFKVVEAGFTDSTAYNRFKAQFIFPIQVLPDPTQILKLFT